MGKCIKTAGGLTIGLDVGDKHTVGCVVSSEGTVLETFRMATTPVAVRRTMEGLLQLRGSLWSSCLAPLRDVPAAGR